MLDRPPAPEIPEERAAPKPSGLEEKLVVGTMRLGQRLMLIAVALLTLYAAGVELHRIVLTASVDLASILLLFLYAEVIAMAAVFYSGRGKTYVFPIFIAVTALARLLVMQGKDEEPVGLLYGAGAILLLALAAVVLLRLTGAERWR
ncbi:MAG: phosphate-starvation-inducible PsiE family protein [Alkalilacustris sp.]